MRSGQLTALVIQPSLFSGFLSLVASVGLLAAANWPTLTSQPLVHDYFLGPEGLVTLLKSSDGSKASLAGLSSESTLNNVIILLAAIAIGLVLLIILESVRRLRTDNGRITTHEAHMRMGTRVLVAVLWVVYFEVTLKMVLPFCILASDVGVHALWEWQGFAYLVFGTALLWGCLHVHVILMRLFLLRVRVFGGEQALIEAESHY